MKIHRIINKNFRFRNYLKKIRDKQKNIDEKTKLKIDLYLSLTNKRIKKLKESLYSEFKSKESPIRNLRSEEIKSKNIISVFDSVLTRILGIPSQSVSTDIMVVQTYYFDILEHIILNGFIYNNEKYICFTASAGQIRTKKTVFIKEKTFLKHRNTLMCGLTVEKINALGGVNINKYLAYLALCNSATEHWLDFDINKAIVVDDMETNVSSIVDFIDDKTYEITRKAMDIPIEHTDGCGMILPRRSKKGMMVRLPWVKGLLVPFPFDKFIRENNKKNGERKYGVVTDIYGKQYDLLKDDIEVIFTRSQFKMWKYYLSWDEYKSKYIEYSCQAGKCNEEEELIGNAKLNYQMLQTLTDITDDELSTILAKTKRNILNVGSDRKTMLDILGVKESNNNKNYMQRALEIYPELLNDTYCREILKQTKRSMVRNAKAGKVTVSGKYTFISPDLYAFCEYLILGVQNPKGLLSNGEVFCGLYGDQERLDCLRSPHLYREHAVRTNKISKEMKRWFITKSLYTSCHDPISKILQFDVDGDKALVCNDKTLVKVADRNMKDIYPLYYQMAKAEAEIITNESIYRGLIAAYTGGNIGMISNEITKIWNSSEVNLDVIKIQCMINNFVIDYAKTLYKPTTPDSKKHLLSKYARSKVPHFFISAKDKLEKNVEPPNDSVVNRLGAMVPNQRVAFKASNLGRFDYRLLLSDKDKNIDLDSTIIDKYTELDLQKRFIEIAPTDNNSTADNVWIYGDIRNQILEVNSDTSYVVDVLVEYLYKHKMSSFKTTLWSCFGDVLVENLKRSIDKGLNDGYIQCETCGERIESTSNSKRFCKLCWKQHRNLYQKELMRNKRSKSVSK
ncbi:hypothetical protein [Paenibacillus sp. ISL-20]|uniref:hypothetical protein n=1 Tax=Paenibacillus sp. ISL-20 TaxID=2819163 RepID=UPI001BECD904|nr:hypothetical protein [Paenibacillus sp. ISL-20]MBT2759866.1 hypothetical protein [Paenibacillus sp. ISL-20]